MTAWVETASVTSILTRLGVDLSGWGAPDYADIAALILTAQAEFERRTNRLFESATLAETLDGSGTSSLVLSGYPVSTVNSIVVTGYANLPVYSFDLTSVETDSDRGILFISKNPLVPFAPGATGYIYSVWPRGRRNIVVNYDYGYEPGPSPANDFPLDILQAIRYMTVIAVLLETPSEAEKRNLKKIKIMDYMEEFGKGGIYDSQVTNWRNAISEAINYYRRLYVGTP
jgi:hypothetical protein